MKKRTIYISIFLGLLILIYLIVGIVIPEYRRTNGLSSNDNFGKVNDKSIDVSITNLIVQPEKYDGVYIRVIGVGAVAQDSGNLFDSKEHYKYFITRNAVWLEFNLKKLDSNIKQLSINDGKYVIVEGIFDSNSKGDMGLYAGTIRDVSRYENYEKFLYERLRKIK